MQQAALLRRLRSLRMGILLIGLRMHSKARRNGCAIPELFAPLEAVIPGYFFPLQLPLVRLYPVPVW